jgi:hypothetical protein
LRFGGEFLPGGMGVSPRGWEKFLKIGVLLRENYGVWGLSQSPFSPTHQFGKKCQNFNPSKFTHFFGKIVAFFFT